MRRFMRWAACGVAFGLVGSLVTAQDNPPKLPPAKEAPAKEKDAVAATVNGKVIPVSAVERALKPVAKENREKARPDIINFLVENALVDHYLELLKLTVEDKEVDAKLTSIKTEVKNNKQDFDKILERMEITEAELKKEIHNQLRWDKFVAQQATDDKLKKLLETSPEIFDGSMVRAKHILITPETQDDAGKAAALKKIQGIKAGVDKSVTDGTAKIPADADNLAKQKQISKLTEDAFAAAAKEHSACPSKRDGGDLGEFPRMGAMVEPFSKAAFALKPFQVSEPVATQFGYHLIMVVSRKPGEKPDFDKIKEAVKEVYGVKLREAIVEKLKADPMTKIEIKK